MMYEQQRFQQPMLKMAMRKKTERTSKAIEEEKLEMLDLSGMSLESLPSPSLNLATIYKLDLSNNNLQNIPESLTARLLNLMVLDVHSNQLRSLPNSIGCLSRLKVLNVSGNLIEYLPKTIENCRLLLENAFRLVYTLVRPEKHDRTGEKEKVYKMSYGRDLKLDGYQDVLCSYINNPHTNFVRRYARRLFLHLCGSKSHYYSVRDNWQFSCEVKRLYKHINKSGSFQNHIPYERSVKIVKCLSTMAEVAAARPRNWQKYCLRHGDILSFLMNGVFYFGEESVIQTLKLLNLAFYTGKDNSHTSQKTESTDVSSNKSGTTPQESKKKKKDEDGSESGSEKSYLNMEAVVDVFTDKSGDALKQFINCFLLEWNSSTVRAEAKLVLCGVWHHAKTYMTLRSRMEKSFIRDLKVTALEELNANFNKLSQLPDTIGFELINLKKLSVNSNKLVFLPRSTSHLTALRVLDARLNCLRSLPEDLENLINLETLNVSQNFQYLDSLPYSIGLLLSLVELDVSYNKIKSLPDSIGCLKKLHKLSVEGNPLASPPPLVVEQGLHAVKEYLCHKMNAGHQSPTKKKSWVGKLVKYGTFNGHVSRSGARERDQEREAFIMPEYRTIDGLASPRYVCMFSPRRLFSHRTYFSN